MTKSQRNEKQKITKYKLETKQKNLDKSDTICVTTLDGSKIKVKKKAQLWVQVIINSNNQNLKNHRLQRMHFFANKKNNLKWSEAIIA